MKHTQSDGFPVTFNLHNAALVSGITTTTLRSYLHRKILRHVGQTPLAGQERRFTLTGLIEVILVEKFASSGIPLEWASQFADAVLRHSFALVTKKSIGKMTSDQEFSFAEHMKTLDDPNHDCRLFDSNPRYFMDQPIWSNREWQNPHVILATRIHRGGATKPSVSVVQGWPKVGEHASDGEVVHMVSLTRVMLNLEMAMEGLASQ